MLRLAKKYLMAFKKELIIGPAAKFTEALFELIVPLLMAEIIDKGVIGGDKDFIYRKGVLIVLLGVLGLCFSLICQYLASKASQGVGTSLRNDLFKHINSLSHAELDKFGTPSLITRLTNDINHLQHAVATLIRLVVRAPFLVIGAIIMAMRIDLKLSLIFLIVAPIISIILYAVMSRTAPFYISIQKKLDRITLLTREWLTGIRVIRAFSRQKTEKARFKEANDDYARACVNAAKLSALLNPLNYAILNAAVAAVLWFGGYRVNSGALTQGQIIAFVNYMTQISLALVVVANLVIIFTKAAASASRVNDVFDTIPSVGDNGKSCVEVFESSPKIQFKNVSFSYSGSIENALENINISIKKGETIGITGGTGSGKSTLVNLIPRFYDCTGGEVLIDGINVKEYSLKNLRGWIGIALQETMLFSGTILENMRIGNENATVDDVIKALKAAQAYDFVEKLPDGVYSLLASGGKNLSGGQRQRLSIARTLVFNPDILILDDSMSALDYATDAALRRSLKKYARDMTVIIVSQRISSIRHADRIIVMDDGVITGIGTHDELLDSNPVYRETVFPQMACRTNK